MHTDHELTHLIALDPKQAKERILKTIEKAQVNVHAAAAKLGVAERTLFRWLKKLDIEDTVEKMRERAKREGWFHDRNTLGGRPPAPKKKTNGRAKHA